MKLLRLLWRIIWNIKTILVTTIIVVSMVTNIVLFIGGSLFSLVNSSFEALTGMQTVASRNKAEITTLSEELIVERKAREELQVKLLDLEKQNVDLRNEQLVYFKGKKVAIGTAVNETADTIAKRASITASREIASMPGEAMPFYGTVVIVGATTLVLSDLCATLKDMTALRSALNPELKSSDEELEVCSMKVPPKEEIVARITASPQKVWQATKDAIPTRAELKEIEIPDVAWNEMWINTSGGITAFGRKLLTWWEG